MALPDGALGSWESTEEADGRGAATLVAEGSCRGEDVEHAVSIETREANLHPLRVEKNPRDIDEMIVA
jgi:hypothetical protein